MRTTFWYCSHIFILLANFYVRHTPKPDPILIRTFRYLEGRYKSCDPMGQKYEDVYATEIRFLRGEIPIECKDAQ
jgi:hypothetical protein